MNFDEVMLQLEEMGTAQNRKIYGRHGAGSNMFGVSYANLGILKKKIKQDHELALQLWETGNHDARVFAGMIIDPQKMEMEQLQAWLAEMNNHILTDVLAGIVGQSRYAEQCMKQWMNTTEEWSQRAGWNLLSQAIQGGRVDSIEELTDYLKQIEEKIHTQKNRVKEAMNQALIGMGTYVLDEPFVATVLESAARIGKVEVDHGDTSCKTPLAVPYIHKSRAHYLNKLAKQAAKKKK